MGSTIEKRSAALRFPHCEADNTDGDGVQRIACTGAAQTYAFKTYQKNKFIWVKAVGVDIQLGTAASAQSLTLNQASSAAASTSSAAAGVSVLSGESKEGIVEPGDTHLCWISTSATGYLEFYVSEFKFS